MKMQKLLLPDEFHKISRERVSAYLDEYPEDVEEIFSYFEQNNIEIVEPEEIIEDDQPEAEESGGTAIFTISI